VTQQGLFCKSDDDDDGGGGGGGDEVIQWFMVLIRHI
jgi:hypothetical protein